MLDEEFVALTDEEFDEQMKYGFIPTVLSFTEGNVGISSPTMAEMVEGTGNSPSQVRRIIKNLVEQGHLIPIEEDGFPSYFHLIKAAATHADIAKWMLRTGLFAPTEGKDSFLVSFGDMTIFVIEGADEWLSQNAK